MTMFSKMNMSSSAWQLCLVFVLTAAIMLLPDLAAAQNVIGDVLCKVVNEWFKGPVGKGIATLAIIIIGIGALMGKVSWGMAIIVGIGVAVVFGAPTLVEEISPDSANKCSA